MTQDTGSNLIPHKQLSLSEILGGALNSLRRMPKTLLGIGLFSGFIVGISSIFTSTLIIRRGDSLEIPELPNPGTAITQEQLEELVAAFTPTLQVAVITAIVLFFVQSISVGLFTHIIGNAIIGKKIQTNQAWEKTKPQLRRIIVLSLISILFPILAVVAGVSIGLALSAISSFFIFVGLGMGIFAAIYIWVGLYVSLPTLILEDSFITISFKRSFYLAKNNMMRVLGIGLIGVITSQALSIVVSTPFTLLAQAGQLQDPTTSSVFMSTMGSIVGYAVMLPFMAAFTTLLYTDLRIRKENIATDLNKAANQ